MHQFKDQAVNDAFDGLLQGINEAEVIRMRGIIYRGVVADLFQSGVLKDDGVFADAEKCLLAHWPELEAAGNVAPLQDAIREVRIEVREMIAKSIL